MKTKLLDLLTPPVFANEENNRIARALHTMFLGVIVAILPFFMLFLFFVPSVNQLIALICLGSLLLTCLVLYFLTRAGYVRLSAILFFYI